MGVLCLTLILLFNTFCPSFAIILVGNSWLITFTLSSWRLVTVSVMWLFLTVPLVNLHYVIVVFPDILICLFKMLSVYKGLNAVMFVCPIPFVTKQSDAT